jgi:hypothetical protein
MRCSSACGVRAVALPSRASRAARPASARDDARSRAVSSRPSQHARDASATGCPLFSTRVAHRGRGLAPPRALPDHISGLRYVPPGRAADPASVPTLAVSQLAASGKGATAQVPTPTATATITVGGWPLVASMGLAAVASLGACGTAFILVMAPALRAVQSASEAAERAASNAERAMEEFEKLSVKTLEDLPRTLDQVESAGKEWDDLGQELRELLTRVERWGQFSGAEEALTKLTASVLEEPSRAIESGYNEAESYVKRLTDDFAQAVAQLTDWESRLTESVRDVEEAAFRETWGGEDGEASKDGKSEESSRARKRIAERQRRAVADAISVAEAATEQARLASLALLGDGKLGGGASVAEAMGVQADTVAESLKSALAAVEQAKEAAADEGVLSSWDEEEDDRERASANVGANDAGDARDEAT